MSKLNNQIAELRESIDQLKEIKELKVIEYPRN